MQVWLTCKVRQISMSQHVSLGIGLHSAKPDNMALTAANPIDSLKETKTTL